MGMNISVILEEASDAVVRSGGFGTRQAESDLAFCVTLISKRRITHPPYKIVKDTEQGNTGKLLILGPDMQATHNACYYL